MDLTNMDREGCEGIPDDYNDPSGEYCKCGKEMTKGEVECFGVCSSCYENE